MSRRWIGYVMLAGITGLFQPDRSQAQTVCNRTGPDVIVGDLTGMGNFSVFSGRDALAFGTVSCNVGNVDLQWVEGTAAHPVIAQNLYKMKTVAGSVRFEQIGMSWLKHGFFATSEELCCTNCVGVPDGSALGVRCADTYDSFLNGFQPSLGPRWQVNAATGVFTYPPANPAYSGTDTTARRLQALTAELEPSAAGASYYGEGHYVSPDDAAAGNAYNNASYRSITVSSSNGNWSFLFNAALPTVREKSAISAWKTVDPDVTETEVLIPGDGKLIVSSRATALGGGQWHYEYAVYNMNSDRSVGSVTVPLSAGTTVTNVGFHDVAYHDGDGPGNLNFSGADWPAVVGCTEVAWSSEPYATNTSANAIRWATLYNFRFDANVAPAVAAAPITLGLFKPGTPASVMALAQVPGAPTCACPGDVNGDGHANGADVAVFARMYTGALAIGPCANLAPPACGALDAADLAAFTAAILTPSCP